MDDAVDFVPAFVLIEIEKRSVDKHVNELEASDTDYHAPNNKVEVLDSTLI